MMAIGIVLLVSCAAFRYENRTYYHPRYGHIKRLSKTAFGGVPFGLPRGLGRPPRELDRHRLENRFPMRQDRDKYHRARSDNPSLAWLRNNPTTTTTTTTPEMPVVQPAHPNSSLGVYGYIQNMQNNAMRVNEDQYKWIARVVPTFRNVKFSPMLCNAGCIEERIFLTTALCLFNAKVLYTRVYYQDEELPPIAFVLPSKPSKQMFNDLGLIVVNNSFTKTWEFIAMHQFKRPDDETFYSHHLFTREWLAGLNITYPITVIGHVGELVSDLPTNDIQVVYTLYKSIIQPDIYLCNYLLNKVHPNDAYFVPCLHRCSLTHVYQQREDETLDLSRCFQYLAGEGHLVIDSDSPPQLYGVMSWAVQYKSGHGLGRLRLPVGMTIPHSPAYLEDLACAQKIKAAPHTSERFDTICN